MAFVIIKPLLKNNLNLFLFLLLAQHSLSQNIIKITDKHGNKIPYCHVYSLKNKVILISNDSGIVNADKIKFSDSLVFSHLSFKPEKIFYQPALFINVTLTVDTLHFDKFIFKPIKCHSKSNKITKFEYGLFSAKMESPHYSAALGYNTQSAQKFQLNHSCGKISEINFYLWKVNKKLSYKYVLNIFLIKADTVDRDTRFYLLNKKIDGKKLKKGWNKLILDSCFFDTKNIIIGFNVIIKEGESVIVSPKESSGDYFFDYPIYLEYINKNTNSFYYATDFKWISLNGQYIINIKTEEYD
jgi:hypothetical protein